jgi:Flp pilus assembly protein TadG
MFTALRSNQKRRRARAQAMVEFALVVLLLVGVMAVIIEGARWITTYFAVANAAAEGARAGAFVPNTSWPVGNVDSKIQAAARSVLMPWMELPNFEGSGVCGVTDEICVCRRQTSTSSCDPRNTSTVLSNSSTIDVTVRYTFRWFPFAAGWLGQVVTSEMTGFHRARIE